MNITIECHCGETYTAEFEPVDGAAPEPICCPRCGTDATESVNQTLRPPPPPPPVSAPPEEVSPPAAAEPAAAEMPRQCYRHSDQPVAMFCFVCKRPICTLCMEHYGFVCSPYCQQQARESGREIPEYEQQRDVVVRKSRRREALAFLGAGLLLLAVIGGWVWYRFWATQPSIVSTVDLGQERATDCRFIGPGQLLVTSARKITLLDVAARTTLWTATSPAGDDEDHWGEPTPVVVTDRDVWLHRGAAFLQLDRQTGREKARHTVAGEIESVTPTPAALVIRSTAGPAQARLTRIDLATGHAQTELADILVVAPRAEPDRGGWDFDAVESDGRPQPVEAQTEFVAAGPNVVQLDFRVTQTNIVAYAAIKDAGQQRADSDMKISESLNIAEEIMTESVRQRTGGRRWEDESTYAVTLRRRFGETVADWRGTVTGPPVLFALPTVDLLVAGKQLIVFNKQNQLLWESALFYPIATEYQADDRGGFSPGNPRAPALEAGDTLYFFDQGVLTAFARATGEVRWRLTTVGISQIEPDADGMLYVATTTASPEDIQYTQQVKITDRARPVLLKVAAATGQTLWRAEKQGDRFYLTDRFVYSSTVTGSGLRDFADAVQGRDIRANFRLYRLDPHTGTARWEYYRAGAPDHVAAQGTTIALCVEGQLEILRYWTFGLR